jgi:RNA recognition motif-containing protein
LNNNGLGYASETATKQKFFMADISRSLRLTGLPESTDEQDILRALDPTLDKIASVKLAKDTEDPSLCLGYGFIHFATPQDAHNAYKKYNGMRIPGMSARFRLSFTSLAEGASIDDFQVYISGFSSEYTDKDLYDMLKAHNVRNVRIIRDISGRSKGYGFAQFSSDEFAFKAVSYHSSLPNQLLIFRETHIPSLAEIERGAVHPNNTVIFIGNLNLAASEADLETALSRFGIVESVRVVPSKGFAFVVFADHVSALAALSELQNTELFHQRVHVAWATGVGGRAEERLISGSTISAMHDESSTSMEYYASMKPHAKKQKISSQVLDRAELLEKSLRQLPSAGSGRERELPQLESIAAIIILE